MKKPKKRPFAEDYNMSRITIENAGSVTDCTGLTPRPPENEAKHDSYSQIKNFFPEDIVSTE